MQEYKRKLATIRTIDNLEPIENSDNLELAKIDGWQVVVRKGTFQKGSPCLFCEIDSFLPLISQFEFLASSGAKTLADGSIGYRIRSKKLRGVLSQGLAIPLSDFADDWNKGMYSELMSAVLGDDVTEFLGIKKYEAPSAAKGQRNAKGNFPIFISKTDQPRIQNLWKEYKQKYNDVEFEVTLKLDGTSATYYYNEGQLGVCSRNLELKMDEDWEDAGLTGTRNRDTYMRCGMNQSIFGYLKLLGRNIAIQGEIMGEGIQGNREKLIGQKFFAFDIWDIDQRRYLTPKEREQHTFLGYGMASEATTHVPLIAKSIKLADFDTLDQLLFYAEGESLTNPVREGLVFKSREIINGEIISFKVISNAFLLAEK